MRQDGIKLRKTRHCTYHSAHHFVWIPYKRRAIFTDKNVAARTEELVAQVANRNEMEILSLNTDRNHIHVFVSFPPRFSASKVVNLLKGYSSRYLRKEFPHLLKMCNNTQLWARSYYWGTAGNVSAQAIKRYIEECQGD